MKNLGPTIDEASRVDDIDPAGLDSIARLRAVLTLCGKRLAAADPLTILLSSLDVIASAFDSQKSELTAFIGDHNAARLATASTFADGVLTQLSQIPAPSSPDELIGLIQAVSAHRTALDEQQRMSSDARRKSNADISELKNTLETFTAQSQRTISEFNGQIETERQKLSAFMSDQQKQFTDAQQSRSTTFNETLLKVQETLTKTITDQQGQFSSAQENRNREFTNAQTESQKRFGDLIT